MAKQQESSNKKENEKRKQQKRKEKEQRREERRAQAKEGKSLDDMIAYVDENGNFTSTPPDPLKKKKEIKVEDIVFGSRNTESHKEDTIRKGVVAFFNDAKGFGFIKDTSSGESIFVHINALSGPIKENDVVTFDVEMGMKGLNAVRVKVIKG